MNAAKRITVLLAEDHAVVREGLRNLLDAESDFEVISEAGTGRQAVEFGHGGEHKYQRGLLPIRTESAHWIADPTMHALLARHLEGERALVDAEIAARNAASARHDP